MYTCALRKIRKRRLRIQFLCLRAEVAEDVAEQRIARIVLRIPLVMEEHFLAKCIHSLLRVEPAVQQHRIAASQLCILRVFHLALQP